MSTEPNPALNLAPLYGALSRATARARAVEKGAENTFHRYRYASAEGLIEEARGALAAEGLCVFPRRHRLVTHDTGEQRLGGDGKPLPPGYFADVEVAYVVAHSDGASMECETTTPVICEKGRPEDKALAAALTYSLGYFLRGLLLLPRVDGDNDVDQRDDRNYEPRQGQNRGGGRDQRQQRADESQQTPRSGSNGTGKLPAQQAPATKPSAPAFDLAPLLATIRAAATREAATQASVNAGVGDQPESVRNMVKAAINARTVELEMQRAGAPAADPTPASEVDSGFARFLGDIERASGEATDGWTAADALNAWEAALHFATSRAQLDELCTPWLTAARRYSGPVVASLRPRIDAGYKARCAELRNASAGAAA